MALNGQSTMGTKISLLSNSQIRYEGYLCGLDQLENTVSLQNVRIFGTEGRRGGELEVPPNPQTFELIVFRGGDIHDLTLFDTAQSTAAVDPAILSVSAGSGGGGVPLATATANAVNANKTFAGAVRTVQQPTSGFSGDAAARQNAYNSRYQGGAGGGGGGRGNYQRRGGYGGRGRGGGHYRRRDDTHTGMDFVPATDKKESFKEEFDFEKAREEFEKNKKEFEAAKEDAKTHNKVYDKSSFFDNISGDQKDRGASRMDREEMKKADTETFGSEMVGRMQTGGGYHRGRGRGGRGRYHQRY